MAGVNRVALVSGAASGIGLATVRELRGRGWTVYAGYRPDGRSAPDALPESSPAAKVGDGDAGSGGYAGDGARGGGVIHWIALDVTDRGARTAAVETIERAHQHLDALVNCAGINGSGPLEEVPESVLRQVMQVNFFGAIGLTRDCLPLMRWSGGGAVVMVSSLSALIGLPFDGAYAASKFALEGATESLRYEVEPFGIRVTLIQPGSYATSLADINATAETGLSAYAAFEKVRLARDGAATAKPGGADPREAALIIVDTIAAAAPPLRVPCGAQAESVRTQLRALDDEQRHAFALRAAGVTR
jgi:NAD(P)-dependent dehydrogenase (short-subunit alcohol dehydrogenase family)